MKSTKYLVENKVDLDLSLTYFGDMDTYNATLKEFQKGLNEKITGVRNAYTRNDLNSYASAVRSMKTDFKYFGFRNLAAIAHSQVMASESGKSDYIQEHYPEFIEELIKAKDIIENYLELGGERKVLMGGNIILVVDDSDVIRSFFNKIFEDKYVIEFAKNGQEALDIIKGPGDAERIKAILLDLNMPEVDGFGVLDYMKENKLFKKIPVSIISGDNTKEAIDRAFTYPIVSMLSKPFKEEKIKEVVEKTISQKTI